MTNSIVEEAHLTERLQAAIKELIQSVFDMAKEKAEGNVGQLVHNQVTILLQVIGILTKIQTEAIAETLTRIEDKRKKGNL